MKPRPQRAVVTATRIRLKRQRYQEAVFLVVEGDDDAKLFQKFVDGHRCRIQPAYERVLPKKTWQVAHNQLIDELQGHSGAGVLDGEATARAVDVLRARAPDRWQLCNGHDMVAILAIGLRHVLGNRNDGEVKPAVLEKDLRLAYEAAYFAETSLYRALRDWHRSSAPILIPALAPAE